MLPIIGDLLNVGMKILDKVIPDPAAKAAAQLELMKLQQAGEFKEEESRYAAITAEATSTDKWTSRARPGFLYVVYILLLSSIPMGITYAISPSTASAVTVGFQAWLAALPPDIIELFKWVMLGYIGGRSVEKLKGVAK